MLLRPLVEGTPIPLAVMPERAGEAGRSALSDWMAGHRERIEGLLREAGALLFRGFDIDTAADFAALVRAFDPDLKDYIGGDSPRTRVLDGVYTSTEYAASQTISLHSEMSYAAAPPRRVFFCCRVAPEAGGETPIADCRVLLRRLDPELRERFERKRLRYVQNLHAGRGIGRSWQAAFETSDRAVVEARCRAQEIELAWKPDGSLRTTQVRDAIAHHPVTGEPVWFNQADQWHPSSLDEKTRKALLALVAEEDLYHYVCFEDGSPIDEADLAAIRAAWAQEEIAFPWQRGDLLVLDNYLIAHGRRPFRGPREVLVAMA